MIVTTTPTLEGKKITEYLGPVTGYATKIHKEAEAALDAAKSNLIENAKKITGANAVVDVSFNYHERVITHEGATPSSITIIATVSGTAVTVE